MTEPIKPRCWANVNKQGDVTHHGNKWSLWARTPLYDQEVLDAAVAAERERWRELVGQLVACHDEPACPAVQWAKDMLSGRVAPSAQDEGT